MVRKGFTPEQIINKLREAEIYINQGISIAEASRKIGITRQTYCRWRKEYGGLRMEQARKLKNLQCLWKLAVLPQHDQRRAITQKVLEHDL
jgi:putative transposase